MFENILQDFVDEAKNKLDEVAEGCNPKKGQAKISTRLGLKPKAKSY